MSAAVECSGVLIGPDGAEDPHAGQRKELRSWDSDLLGLGLCFHFTFILQTPGSRRL